MSGPVFEENDFEEFLQDEPEKEDDNTDDDDDTDDSNDEDAEENEESDDDDDHSDDHEEDGDDADDSSDEDVEEHEDDDHFDDHEEDVDDEADDSNDEDAGENEENDDSDDHEEDDGDDGNPGVDLKKVFYKLKTSDQQIIKVERDVILECNVLRILVEESELPKKDSKPIPLRRVASNALHKVVEYCKKHIAHRVDPDNEINAWDNNFINVDKNTIFELMLASHYLDVPGLYSLACQAAANLAEDKSAAELRQIYMYP